jgi:1,2-diacylglycerol 3-beta-galactosyltransferase
VPYNLTKQNQIQKAINSLIIRRLKEVTVEEIKSFKPDLIISTYFLYNPVLEKINDFQTEAIPFMNIIANTWVLHPLEFSQKANLNFVYDKRAIQMGKKYGISREKILAGGWLVRKQFYRNRDQKELRNSLGFDSDIFTAVICGGSEGTSMILKILPSLLTNNKKLQLIIICGTNKELYKATQSFKKLIKKIKDYNIQKFKNIDKRLHLKIFKFTQKMPQLLAASDLVIGKAGPNLLFESVASKKPFFAITHISGQEDGNLEIIKQKNLGYVQENSIKANKLIKKLLNNPKHLNQFQETVAEERKNNSKAEKKLLKAIKKLI